MPFFRRFVSHRLPSPRVRLPAGVDLHDREEVLATARLLSGISAFVAILLDPTELRIFQPLAYTLLAASGLHLAMPLRRRWARSQGP